MTIKKIKEKTKNPQYKNLWYKLVEEWANVQNTSNTNSFVQRNIGKRNNGFH